MMSRDDAPDWSIGASGIAWADTLTRPRAKANADAARIFIGSFLSSRFAADAAQSGLRKQHGGPVTASDITETDRPTNGDGANGDASGAAAKPMPAPVTYANDAGANAIAGASDGANGPAPP
jgi:hypothetical protein